MSFVLPVDCWFDKPDDVPPCSSQKLKGRVDRLGRDLGGRVKQLKSVVDVVVQKEEEAITTSRASFSGGPASLYGGAVCTVCLWVRVPDVLGCQYQCRRWSWVKGGD